MKKFSILTTFVTFLALILGNLVVATNSGDACGTTWPVCNGHVIPDFTDYHVLIEYSHRLMVPLLVFLTAINAVGAIYKYRKQKSVFVLAVLSLVLLILQSMIGGLNVLLGTPPGFTTFDVTFSQLLLIVLVLLSYSLHEKKIELNRTSWESVSMSYRAFLIGYMAYVAQVILGAFFKHSRASNVMMDIPAMEYLITSESVANAVYSLHWVATFVVIVAAIWFVIYASRFNYHILLSWLYLISLLLNAVVGFIIVVTGNVVLASSMHMLISTVTMVIGACILGGYWFKLQKKTLNA
ncbi:cytochrome c oxidase assembly protein subunit 15 [Halobacillus karajensis]|uniref:Heme A synthase n=1 Tax=Halobacillus karajensis TaxID=195088 RepID=A0A059NY06_9BACI|nr:COX15/CtaA family protein [Halobacillus karajensis]CDQ19230.1 Heme A synthase [Halobacillus karajensis]CDQ22696.1 Heme A synthase [Halobacillus karajensis]CDQ26178.1 Heme A synthase [Halobacillus karajensis]SEH39712.1 cytochrome c oxidase assembly protein subunit 15 [Halobacillus karajensis]